MCSSCAAAGSITPAGAEVLHEAMADNANFADACRPSSLGFQKAPAGRIKPQLPHCRGTRVATSAGVELVAALSGRHEGEPVRFSRPLVVAEMEFTHATILRDFRTASQAKLLQMHPSGAHFVCKFGDLSQEHALMCAVRQMNHRWRQHGLSVCGHPVEAVSYRIIPLNSQVGLVEAVPESKTMYDLAQECCQSDRLSRVLKELHEDAKRLDKLAATTAGYLTMGYVLGVRDGHDENLMLRSDGAFFRIDFGFAFGRTPEIDAPAVFVPRAVAFALGPRRWAEVVDACTTALQVLSGDEVRTLSLTSSAWGLAATSMVNSQPPGWDCLRCVPELGPFLGEARAHANTLSFEGFAKELRQADRWSFARATKNTIRQAVRYLAHETELSTPKDWLGVLDPFGLVSRVRMPGNPSTAGEGL